MYISANIIDNLKLPIMRAYLLPVFFLLNGILTGQINQNVNDYYLSFLKARESENYIHSIDSIFYGKFHKFKVLEKSPSSDVTKATVHKVRSGWEPVNYHLDVDYYDDRKFSDILLYKKQDNLIDTIRYFKYDPDGRLILEQYYYDTDYCGTGNPFNYERTIYQYNQEKKLISKLNQTKWSSCSQEELGGKWIDHLKHDYIYDDSSRIVEEFVYSNLWREGDSIRTELIPVKHFKYLYENGKLKDKYEERTDSVNNIWLNNKHENYSYKGDSVFDVVSIWNSELMEWEKDARLINYIHDGKTDVLSQKWSKILNSWVNFDYSYYLDSGFDGYFDYYYAIWDDIDWWVVHSKKYSVNGSWVTKKEYHDHSGTLVTNSKYDDKHNLLKKTKFFLWGSSSTQVYDQDNKYNHFDNITEEHSINYNYNSGEFSKESYNHYYWHTEKKNLQVYSPLVYRDNEWNMGVWSKLGDTLSYVKNYTFSDYTIGSEKKYRELLLLNPDSGTSPKRTEQYYREENGKIWINTEEGDKLLFDFALEIGDTFNNESNTKLIVDTTFYRTMENGEERKVLQLRCFENSDLKTTWIEGIGDLGGGLALNASSCFVGWDKSLVCFHQDGELVYRSSEFDYCWPTSNKEIELTKLKIVPNPAMNEIRIISDNQIEEAKIYNISGKLIKTSQAKRIDIQALKPGLYIVKMKTGDKLQIGKFVKM